MNVDMDIIRERKKIYGDNFKTIVNKFNEYLGFEDTGVELDPKDIALMMALMKDARIEDTKKMLKLEISKRTSEQNQCKIKMFQDSIEDSEKDKANYEAIANNWEWYKAIGTDKEFELKPKVFDSKKSCSAKKLEIKGK